MPHARQLAAIMFTDIVGFTALMGKDVEYGLNLIRKNRLIQKPLIEKYNGKWLKEMGDGVLAQFGSAIDSVLCALEIQKLARKDLGAKIRIGIHLGDVTTENEDVFGDGVNIASRIQGIADPGGIYITESIHDAIRAKKGLESQFFGEVQLKNVDHLVRTYYLVDEGLPIPSKNKIKNLIQQNPFAFRNHIKKYAFGMLLVLIALSVYWFSDKTGGKIRSLAILPVQNLTANLDDDWLKIAIYYGLSDAVGKVQKLRLVNRATVMKILKSELTIPELAKKLNVDGIIEASFSKTGKNLSIQARLIKAKPEERQIWNQSYEKPINNVLSIYEAIAKTVAEKAEIILTSLEIGNLTGSKEIDPRAYKLYTTGLVHSQNLTKESLEKALEYFNQAIEIDPKFALAYSAISGVWGAHVQQGFLPYSVVGPKANKASYKALELDSTQVEIRWRLAASYTWREWNWEKAGIEFERAFKINPNFTVANAYYSHYLSYLGRAEEGLTYGEKAIELEPQNTLYQVIHGMALKNAKKYDEALDLLKKILKTTPNEIIAIPALWAVYHQNEMFPEAFELAKLRYSAKQDYSALDVLEDGYLEGGYHMAMRRTAELMISRKDSSFVPAWQIATLYTRSGLKEESVFWLKKAFDEHDPNMPYISIDPLFDELRNDPGFVELFNKMDFPKN